MEINIMPSLHFRIEQLITLIVIGVVFYFLFSINKSVGNLY